MPRKPPNRKNRCYTCRYFQTYIITDAYGDKYQAARCTNPKSDRDKTWRSRGACKCYGKKIIPTSGDYCDFIRDRIVYTDKTPKSSLPCFKCKARCVFAFDKKTYDFTRRRGRQVMMEDVMKDESLKDDD